MIELLSPVGDFECLKAAVQNGANAVYFGAKSFGARAFASNFDDNTLCISALIFHSPIIKILFLSLLYHLSHLSLEVYHLVFHLHNSMCALKFFIQ